MSTSTNHGYPHLITEFDFEFDNFMLKEYDNIAQAHFKTIETISEFFKHYLSLVTIPITVLAVALNLDIVKEGLSGTSHPILFSIGLSVVSILFLVIAIVGLMVLWHTVNLRLDVLLYARTVNGVRKYYYDNAARIDLATKNKIRVLPQSPLLPEYREFFFFGPVVLSFAFLDSLYLFFSIAALEIALSLANPALIIIPPITFFAIYIILYIYFAQQREFNFQRSNAIGIDIDGVLNLHRNQFCKVLEQNRWIKITPEQITKIPVHECEGLGVTADDEKTVFNDPSYWIEMPVSLQVAEVISKIKNSFKMNIYLFTSRAWPIPGPDISKEGKKEIECPVAHRRKGFSETDCAWKTKIYFT